MNPIVLALVTSYLDALQRSHEWQAPLGEYGLRRIVWKYYQSISPSTRRHVLQELDWSKRLPGVN